MVTEVSHVGLAARVIDALGVVMDPELPQVRIVDLGIVEDVRVFADRIEIDLVPTFSGCPALDIIGQDVSAAASTVSGGRDVHVRFRRDIAWTTDRVNDRAKEAMGGMGIAPPGDRSQVTLVQITARCPYCGSSDTAHESTFGPTLCRAVRYCNACRNPFEAFKAK